MQSEKLLTMARNTPNRRDGCQSLLTVSHALVHDVQWHFALMCLLFPLFFYIFNEFLTLRTATFIEARINGVFIRIHQFTHLHTKQKCLAVTFRNTKTAEQFRRDFSTLIISFQHQAGSFLINAIIKGELLEPEILVLTAIAVPRITSPNLIPHPVAVNLQFTFPISKFVCRIGPVPITGLRIEVKTFGMVHTMHSLNSLLSKSW